MLLMHRNRGRLGLMALVFAAAGAIVSAQSSLTLVSTAWSPFTNAPGAPRFALDLVEEALRRIGVTATTSIVDPADFTTSLLSGPFDGSAAAWRDAERERVLLFSEPYLENRLILVGRRGSDVSATSPEALAGKRIALVDGYSYGEALDRSGAVIVATAREEDSLRLLLDGAVDYTLMDELVIEYIRSNHAAQAEAQLALGEVPLVRRPLYFAVRRSVPDAAGLVSRFNAQLTAMIADRTYHRLLHVDWIVADVDDDGREEFVPSVERPGPIPPLRAYTVFTPSEVQRPVQLSPRFYIGGQAYDAWRDVPDSYKVSTPGQVPASKATLSSFTFSW